MLKQGRVLEWEFPLERTHCGLLQGNGTFGAMIWGDRRLHVTLGRADFWDRRGGHPFTEQMTYQTIRRCLQDGDERRLREIFEGTPPPAGQPRRPSMLPMGRLELDFGSEAVVRRGTLDLATGEARLDVRQGRTRHQVTMILSMHEPCLWIRLGSGLKLKTVVRKPAWEFVGEYLKSISFQPPILFQDRRLSGWVQCRPADPAMCLGYRRLSDGLLVTSVYGETPEAARQAASRQLDAVQARGWAALRQANRAWWRSYWQDVPTVEVPNPALQEILDYGMYKFAGLTNPAGVPATLQGPWFEEYQMPPWCGDYHFNINVQECYWPAFAGNRLAHLRPLFDMIQRWEPELRRNARLFVGVEDGRMLPHAVDDRGVCMGGFWTGTIDHGSTAWVGHLMWLYYRYSLDTDFLRQTAFPFLRGAMAVYEAMLEETADGLVLPVSVSPEYGGAAMDAWGRNASFQLAAIHFLADALLRACAVLGETPKPIWKQIQERLPRACLFEDSRGSRIALWEGRDLERSHRHHSHLAGIYPFDTLPYHEEPWKGIVDRSIWHWVWKGMGEWSGWCVPWASIRNGRLGRGEAAELLLEIWKRVFTNAGRGTLHDVDFPGFSCMGPRQPEIMQIEAGMGATAAVYEMLLHTAGGVLHVFPGVPRAWKDCRFTNLRAEGAFLVSAQRRQGCTVSVTLVSEAGAPLRLENPFAGACLIRRPSGQTQTADRLLELATAPGERITLVPAASP